MIPGEEIKISLPLDQMAYRVPKGHCIHVEVSSTYWPPLWPSRSLIELTLHVGKIDTPVRRSGEQGERIFSAPEVDHPWKIETFRPARNERRQISGMASGTVTPEILDHFGSTKGLTTGSCTALWPANGGQSTLKTRSALAGGHTGPMKTAGPLGPCARKPIPV